MVKLQLGRTKIGRGHFIEVQVLILSTQLFLDFKHWPLNRGWSLNGGSTVFFRWFQRASNLKLLSTVRF